MTSGPGHSGRAHPRASHVGDKVRVLGLQDQVRDLSRELTQLRASARDATTLIRDMKDALEELPKDEGNDLIRRAMLWLDSGSDA